MCERTGEFIMSFQSVCKRYCLFLTGVILCATGIAFITRAGLGTSPVSGLPFVLSLLTPVSMGFFTFLFNMIFLICEALLRKRFSVEQALQIPITFFFSFCIDKAMAIIPTRFGGPWGDSFVYLVIGCIIMSLGISFEVIADVIMLPAEAFVRALAKKTGFIFGNVKVGFDSTLTILAMILALICFHKLNGVREGTLINALVVGQLVKQWRRCIEKPLSNAIA